MLNHAECVSPSSVVESIQNESPLLKVTELSKLYSPGKGCQNINLELYPGEVLGIVGESGSGKSTLLRVLSGREMPDAGHVDYHNGDSAIDLYNQPDRERRRLLRTEWGVVHQHPMDGLRPRVSAGAILEKG